MSQDRKDSLNSQIVRPQALNVTPPGTSGGHVQAPDDAHLQTGDMIAGNRFRVERFLGKSTSILNYECIDVEANKPVVLKIVRKQLQMSDNDRKSLDRAVKMATTVRAPGLVPIFGAGKTQTGEMFVVTDFVSGPSLGFILVEHRKAGKKVTIRDVFAVMSHLAAILKEVHRTTFHAVITPYNIHLTRRGQLLISNFGIGAQLAAIEAKNLNSGPFVDSIYVAPGILEMPDMLSSIDDIYSLGMISVELLHPKGLSNNRVTATREALDFLGTLPAELSNILSAAISPQVTRRQKTVEQFIQEFEKAALKLDSNLYAEPGPAELPVRALRLSSVEQDLFDLPDFDLPAAAGEEGQYLLQINGLDYGPFTKEEVLKKLYADEINEDTEILDRTTQERCRLIDSPTFEEAVTTYIPQRNERIRLAQEARERNIKRVKSGGIGIFVVGIIASVIVLSVLGYFLYKLPDPEPLPVAIALPKQDFVFRPPPKDFVAVAVDKDFLNLLFNPKASDEEIAKRYKKKARRGPGKKGKGGDSDENVTEIDLSQSGGTRHVLTDGEVNDVVMSDFSAIRRCIMTQLKKEPGFKGITVLFFVRPSGTTGGVKIKEAKYQSSAVGQCIVGRIRNLRFPAHGGFNRSVAFPFNIQ